MAPALAIMDEDCKSPPEFSGHYAAGIYGRIHGLKRHARCENQFGESTRTVPAKILRPYRRADGRMVVTLCVDGIQCKRSVAALVLEAWVGPRPKGHYVEHVNGDLTDCRLANLRWVPRRGQPRFRPKTVRAA